MKISLEHVYYMPKELKPGILYVSDEFKTAAHLCACGCGSKIRTPLTATEWSLKDTTNGPTLYPSVGNWQQQCQSHYWICQGEVIWAEKWSHEQINAGRLNEELRRHAYYTTHTNQDNGYLQKLWIWLKGLLE